MLLMNILPIRLMPNAKEISQTIPGSVIFAFSVESNRGENIYHVFYDPKADDRNGIPQLPGAIYKLLNDQPGLIEPIVNVCEMAIQDLNKPFQEILKK